MTDGRCATRPRPPSIRSLIGRGLERDAPSLPAALVGRGNRRCFIVKDHEGQSLAYVYSEEEPGRRAAAKLLTRDEARRIAANIAKLPGTCWHI